MPGGIILLQSEMTSGKFEGQYFSFSYSKVLCGSKTMCLSVQRLKRKPVLEPAVNSLGKISCAVNDE